MSRERPVSPKLDLPGSSAAGVFGDLSPGFVDAQLFCVCVRSPVKLGALDRCVAEKLKPDGLGTIPLRDVPRCV